MINLFRISVIYLLCSTSSQWNFGIETATRGAASAFQPSLPSLLSQRNCLVANKRFYGYVIIKSSPEDSDNNEKKKNKKRGYQFGDITKTIIGKITNKDEYEFGDLSRHLDSKVKDRIAELNNKNTYEFGDLTRYLVKDFTNSTEYQFGDITKSIIKKVKSNDYTMEDLALLVKALVSFGVGISPVASFLPVKLLIELLNYSIAGDLGTKVVSSITLEIDKRMKNAIVGDENYQVGDLTKKAVLKYTGRDEYNFGDITKTVVEGLDEYEKQQKEIARLNEKLKAGKDISENTNDNRIERPAAFLSDDNDYNDIAKELQKWDERYLKELNQNEK